MTTALHILAVWLLIQPIGLALWMLIKRRDRAEEREIARWIELHPGMSIERRRR